MSLVVHQQQHIKQLILLCFACSGLCLHEESTLWRELYLFECGVCVFAVSKGSPNQILKKNLRMKQ